MTQGSKRMLAAAGALAVIMGLARAGARARAQLGSARPAPAGPAPKTAGERFKNVQVLKSMPADEMDATMGFVAASLGVRCSYCHVQGDFSKDDKHPKVRAREMIRMELAINQANFHGRPVVTCYTCHRGLAHPVGVPVIAEQAASAAPEGVMNGGSTNFAAIPPAAKILDKYAEALGGIDSLQKISSRVEKGTVTGFGRGQSPVEIFAKAPDKRMIVLQTPRGEMVQAYDGTKGWVSASGHPARELEGPALAAMRLDAQFYFPVESKQLYGQFRVGRPAKVGDADAYLLMGFRRGQPPVQLYFDEQSGLLLRMVEFTETPLGRLPTQTDFSDYRETRGVKVPFRMTISRPGGQYVVQLDQVQQNAPIDDSKFAEPSASAAPGQNAPSPGP